MNLNFKAAEHCNFSDEHFKHKVYIVDDSLLIRAGLRYTLTSTNLFSIAGEADYSSDFPKDIKSSKADVILFSSYLSKKRSLEEIKQIKTDNNVKTIIMTDEPDEEEFYNSVLMGVDGYCKKTNKAEDIIELVRKVAGGDKYVCLDMSNLVHNIIKHMGQLHPLPIDKPIEEQVGLTEREMQVLALVSNNITNQEIADRLFISPNTVKHHLKNTYKKMGLKNRFDAALSVKLRSYHLCLKD